MCGMNIFGVLEAKDFKTTFLKALCFTYVPSGHLCVPWIPLAHCRRMADPDFRCGYCRRAGKLFSPRSIHLMYERWGIPSRWLYESSFYRILWLSQFAIPLSSSPWVALRKHTCSLRVVFLLCESFRPPFLTQMYYREWDNKCILYFHFSGDFRNAVNTDWKVFDVGQNMNWKKPNRLV